MSSLDFATSLMAGIVIFAVLGHLATEMDLDISKVAKGGEYVTLIKCLKSELLKSKRMYMYLSVWLEILRGYLTQRHGIWFGDIPEPMWVNDEKDFH